MTALQEYVASASLVGNGSATLLADRFEEIDQSCDKVETMKVVAVQEGKSFGTVRRLYYAWKAAGKSAVVLVDGRRNRTPSKASDYYDEFKRYAAGNKNDSKNGYRSLLRDLRAGKSFSFGTWRDCWISDNPYEPVPNLCPAGFVPKGLTYGNMMAKMQKDASAKISLMWSRRGQFAAMKYTLPVFRSRVGLHVGEVVQSDDVWHNIDVFAKGVQGVFNPLEFAFYDVASAYKVVSAIKPRTQSLDAKGEWKRDNLTEFQYRLAVAFLMCCQGFYKDGITLIGERGTTALREPVLRKIAGVPGYGRLFRFQTSGVKNQPVARGMFLGNAGGNPRMKSLCECAHNILHNATAGLLGNHGRDAAHKTESLGAVVKYSNDVLEQARAIDPVLVTMLQLPILEFDNYLKYFRMIEDEVMDRHDTRLEGWEENYLVEYRLGEGSAWRPARELADMTQEQAAAVGAVLAQDKEKLMRQRKMSRREVWAAGQKDLIKWPLMDMPAFLDERDVRQGKVRDGGYIEFTDATYYAGQTMRYLAAYKGRNGLLTRIAPGERVTFYWNPLGTLSEQIWIVGKDGEVAGMCPLIKKASWADPDSIKVAMGQQLHQTAELMRDARATAADEAARQIAAKEYNRALLEGAKAAKAKPVTLDGVDAADVLALTDRDGGQWTDRPTDDDFDEEEGFLDRMNKASK